MASGTAAQFDAASGFHDIKPLPEFHPVPLWFWGCLVLIGLGVVLYRLLVRTEKHRPEPEVIVPPEDTALRALAELSRERSCRSVGSRAFAAGLSAVLREYLERVFGFAASEQTATEVSRQIRQAVKKSLPLLPQEKLDELTSDVLRVLKVCERAAFADRAEILYPLDSEEFSQALETSQFAVKNAAAWLRRENDRTRSVCDTGGRQRISERSADAP